MLMQTEKIERDVVRTEDGLQPWRAPVLEMRHVGKCYGTVRALTGVSLQLFPGTVYGVIGHNGAGKTTLLNLAGNLAGGHTGEVYRRPQLRIGLMPEHAGFYSGCSAVDNLELKALAMGVSSARRRATELVAMANLPEKRKVRTFSAGMRQRLAFVMALVGEPDLLLLDDPFNGMDDAGRAFVCREVKRCKERGVTVVAAGHQVAMLKQMADEYFVLADGEIVRHVCAASLRAIRNRRLYLQVRDLTVAVVSLRKRCPELDFTVDDGGVIVISNPPENVSRIFKRLIKDKVKITASHTTARDIEDVLAATGGSDD
ncbi:MAG: ABC transporter ATP-binding protein [Eubacteriales bacterium]|nr:ABC transporter ATP-binding protein [Eubacteriales bacterium]